MFVCKQSDVFLGKRLITTHIQSQTFFFSGGKINNKFNCPVWINDTEFHELGCDFLPLPYFFPSVALIVEGENYPGLGSSYSDAFCVAKTLPTLIHAVFNEHRAVTPLKN